MRHDAALASLQGKYSPAFVGSWLGAPAHSHGRGHGNKLLFESANAVLLFCLRGREERNSPGALLRSAASFVVPDLIKGRVGGSAEGKGKGEKRAGGAGGCAAESLGLQEVLPGTSRGSRRMARTQGSSALPSPLGSKTQSWPRGAQPGDSQAKQGQSLAIPCFVCGRQPPPAPASPRRAGCRHVVPAGYTPGVASINHPRKTLRLTLEGRWGNRSLGKSLHAFAYELQPKSNSWQPKPGLCHGFAVPFAPLVAAPGSRAH